MTNILETELISDEQMLSLMGGGSCVSCTETLKKERGNTTTTFKPEATFDLDKEDETETAE